MSQGEKKILEHLGGAGIARALDELLDTGRLVQLANACGLHYPGMRTRSQSRARLLSDLADKALADDTAGLAVLRVLDKQTRTARAEWRRIDPEERGRRVADEARLRSDGKLGLHLYLVASADDAGSDDAKATLDRLLRHAQSAPEAPPAATGPTREESRLRKRAAEFEKKLQYLEGQLQRSREIERATKRDLIQRKGELAESRMLVERLRQEIREVQETARRAVATRPEPSATPSLEDLARAVRKLSTEHRRLVHRLDHPEEPDAPSDAAPVSVDPASLSPIVEALDLLRKETAAARREAKREIERHVTTLEEVRAGMQRRADGAPIRRARAKGEPERIGVFIDVQNMYYGARRLKGKLDFDALLQAAVRERRLIQATAYVVESKEVDQSGFIALLEQRAIEVRRKTLRIRVDGSMKGDWDMELALDILDAAPRLDVVVLVSGDGDFTSLVKRVKAMGPRVEVVGFPRTSAKSLVEAADEYHPLDRRFMIYPARAKALPDEPAERQAEAPAPPPPEPESEPVSA
jgi:uncharacterized LabA/DUF88 family protein